METLSPVEEKLSRLSPHVARGNVVFQPLDADGIPEAVIMVPLDKLKLEDGPMQREDSPVPSQLDEPLQ